MATLKDRSQIVLGKASKRLQTDSGRRIGLSNAELLLINYDLQPVETERRLWVAGNYVGYWISDSFSIGSWMVASVSIVNGLTWWQAWLCVWIGSTVGAILTVMSGRIGAKYHIGFPVISRASFGIWGAWWPVLNRAVLACLWYGVQAWVGGNCVTLMLRSISENYNQIPNTMPVGNGTNTRDWLSFFIFWLCSIPALMVPVQKIRHLFTLKAIVVPVASILFLVWVLVRSKSIGAVFHQKNTIHGGALAIEMIKASISNVAYYSTFVLNDSDFTRFAKTPRDALYSQLVTIPSSMAFVSFVGIMISSASTSLHDEVVWNPLDQLSRFLDEDAGKSSTRAAVFFIALSFALSQLGMNIAANSISAGSDLTALFPRFISIRRGALFCAFVGLIMCPWKIVSSSSNFTNYVSAYTVFFSALAGVLLTDYYVIRKGYLIIPSLYQSFQTSPYHYTCGYNPRAYVAYLAGVLVNIVGFVGAVTDESKIPAGARYIFVVNYVAGFIIAGLVYWILCSIWKMDGLSPDGQWNEEGQRYGEGYYSEEYAKETRGSEFGDIEFNVPDSKDERVVSTLKPVDTGAL